MWKRSSTLYGHGSHCLQGCRWGFCTTCTCSYDIISLTARGNWHKPHSLSRHTLSEPAGDRLEIKKQPLRRHQGLFLYESQSYHTPPCVAFPRVSNNSHQLPTSACYNIVKELMLFFPGGWASMSSAFASPSLHTSLIIIASLLQLVQLAFWIIFLNSSTGWVRGTGWEGLWLW